jgi:uncharacterized membrane protein
MAASIETSIDVDVPVRTAYNQWTQFETFPEFMGGVVEVTQLSDTKLHWKAKVAGKEKEWDAEITEQKPDERVAWKAVDGAPNAGLVTFHRLDNGRTRVRLKLEAEPEGIVEEVGDKLGLFGHRIAGDLERFKHFVESRGAATGPWRGEVDQTNA